MFDPPDRILVELPADGPAYLMVMVDTEESFDWSRPLSRDNIHVDAFEPQQAAHDIFEPMAIVPTYVVDYPVARDAAAVAFLRNLAGDGRCEIGAHLHPWVNPPHDEAVTPRNSFPGNLPPELERAKLEILTDTLAQAFGRRPVAYKAGRYGIGAATPQTLRALGYRVDLSVRANTDHSADHGPDFRAIDHRPFWFDAARSVLEVPLTVGFAGALSSNAGRWYWRLAAGWPARVHAAGVAARLSLLERIPLSPEGADAAAHRRLIDALWARGCRCFCLAYHSPSLIPGRTPYVRDTGELRQFLATLRETCGYLIDRKGCVPTTPSELFARLSADNG